MAKSYNLGKVVGPQGYSPEVDLSKEGGTLTITVTNQSGTQTESIETGENVQGDWSETDTSNEAYIWNKPTKVSQFTNDSGYAKNSELSSVATSGSYNDLTNRPTIPTVTSTYSSVSTEAMNGIAVSSAISGFIRLSDDTTYDPVQ